MYYDKEYLKGELDLVKGSMKNIDLGQISNLESLTEWHYNRLIGYTKNYAILPRSELLAEIRCAILEKRDSDQILRGRHINKTAYNLAKSYGVYLSQKKGQSSDNLFLENTKRFSALIHKDECIFYGLYSNAPVEEDHRLTEIIEYCRKCGISRTFEKFDLPKMSTSKGRKIKYILKKMGMVNMKKRGRKPVQTPKIKSMNQKIKNAYLKNKMGVRDICSEFGISRGALYDSLRRSGVEIGAKKGRGGRKKGLSEKSMKIALEAKRLYLQNRMSSKEICKKLSIAIGTLYNYLRAVGVETGKKSSNGPNRFSDELKTMNIDEIEHLIELANKEIERKSNLI